MVFESSGRDGGIAFLSFFFLPQKHLQEKQIESWVTPQPNVSVPMASVCVSMCVRLFLMRAGVTQRNVRC